MDLKKYTEPLGGTKKFIILSIVIGSVFVASGGYTALMRLSSRASDSTDTTLTDTPVSSRAPHSETTSETTIEVGVDVLDYDGHSFACYFGCSTWEEAQNQCENMGGHLAVITSQEENDVLFDFTRYCGYDNVYIGYSDVEEEGNWQWVNGDTSGYTNWTEGEPNGFTESENYAVFGDNGAWYDGEFTPRIENGLISFICEWDYHVIGATNISNEELQAYIEEPDSEPQDADYSIQSQNPSSYINNVGSGDYNVPNIQLNSAYANSVNEEIDSIYNECMNSDDDIYAPAEESNYIYFLSDNGCLSLLFVVRHMFEGNYYYVYNIDINTGNRLDNSEIAQMAGVQDIRQAAMDAAQSYINNQGVAIVSNYQVVELTEDYDDLGEIFRANYSDLVDRTFGTDNLNSSMMIGLTDTGSLFFVSEMAAAGGAGVYYQAYDTNGNSLWQFNNWNN